MYIFLDESGNFKGDKECFVVGGFITNNPKQTAKSFRKWQHLKFPKKVRHQAEVKFSVSGFSSELKAKTLFYFAKQDIRIFYTFLNTHNIPLEFQKAKGLESGRLYAEVIAETLRLLFPISDLEFRVFLDERRLKNLTRVEFKELLKIGLLPGLPAKAVWQIEMLDSFTNTNIQIADWICGALYRYHTKGKNGQVFFDTLRNNILISGELFKDYWSEFNKAKKSPHNS